MVSVSVTVLRQRFLSVKQAHRRTVPLPWRSLFYPHPSSGNVAPCLEGASRASHLLVLALCPRSGNSPAPTLLPAHLIHLTWWMHTCRPLPQFSQKTSALTPLYWLLFSTSAQGSLGHGLTNSTLQNNCTWAGDLPVPIKTNRTTMTKTTTTKSSACKGDANKS